MRERSLIFAVVLLILGALQTASGFDAARQSLACVGSVVERLSAAVPEERAGRLGPSVIDDLAKKASTATTPGWSYWLEVSRLWMGGALVGMAVGQFGMWRIIRQASS